MLGGLLDGFLTLLLLHCIDSVKRGHQAIFPHFPTFSRYCFDNYQKGCIFVPQWATIRSFEMRLIPLGSYSPEGY